MENKSKLDQKLQELMTWLNEQEAFQTLKAKWDELDPQQQIYVKVGSLAGGLFLVMAFLFTAFSSIYTLKDELDDKLELLTQLQTASAELSAGSGTLSKQLNESGEVGEFDWTQYFSTLATKAGIDPSLVQIEAKEKSTPKENVEESSLLLTLGEITIDDLIGYIIAIESSDQPAKVKQMNLESRGKESPLTATIHVSGFQLKE